MSTTPLRFAAEGPGLPAEPVIRVDGMPFDGPGHREDLHLSHWKGNRTPAPLKADTSTEICLHLAAAPDRARWIGGRSLVVNNHADADGVLSVWAVLEPDAALGLREALMRVAEAGDFSDAAEDVAVQANLSILHLVDREESAPSAKGPSDEARMQRIYDAVLPRVAEAVLEPAAYRSAWEAPFSRYRESLSGLDRGIVRLATPRPGLTVVEGREGVFRDEAWIEGYAPDGSFADNPLHVSSIALTSRVRTPWHLIVAEGTEGRRFSLRKPYYAWAETVRRPAVPTPDLSGAIARLQDAERGPGRWTWGANGLTEELSLVDGERWGSPSSLSTAQVVDAVAPFLSPAR